MVRANEPEVHADQQKCRSTRRIAFATANRRQGIINATAVWDVKWMPGSENLFLAAHDDGTLVVYDKEKEDAALSPTSTRARRRRRLRTRASHGCRFSSRCGRRPRRRTQSRTGRCATSASMQLSFRQTACTWPWSVAMGACASLIFTRKSKSI